jgi:hypothetical protein
LRAGQRIALDVTLRQTVPGAEGCQADVRLQYPMKKPVFWIIAVATEYYGLLAVKCVTVAKTLTVRLEFTLPDEGEYQLELRVNCDSYMGLAQCIDLDKIYVNN